MFLTNYLEITPIGVGRNLVINFLKGDAWILSEEETNSLKKLELDEDAMKYWKDRGFLVDSKEEEENIVNNLITLCNKIDKKSKFIAATIIPSYKCNCSCSYCFEGDVTRKDHKLTKSMVDKIFNHLIMKRTIKDNSIGISLFGGEPLLLENYDIIKYIFEKGIALKSEFYITTNGTTLNHYINLFKQNNSHLKEIQITIDGPKSIHDKRRKLKTGGGSFDVIMKNIQLCLDNFPSAEVRINTTISNNESLNKLIELYEIYEEKGFTKYDNFNYVLTPIKQSRGCQSDSCVIAEYEFYLRLLKILYEKNPFPKKMHWGMTAWQSNILRSIIKNKTMDLPFLKACNASNLKTLIYDPEGNLYACPHEVGISAKSIGTWYPNWILNDYAKKWENRTFINIPECRECKYAFICKGGCGNIAEIRNGSIMAPFCNGKEEEKLILHKWIKLEAERLGI